MEDSKDRFGSFKIALEARIEFVWAVGVDKWVFKYGTMLIFTWGFARFEFDVRVKAPWSAIQMVLMSDVT